MSVGPVTVYAVVLDARSFAGAGRGVAAWRRGAWGCQGVKKAHNHKRMVYKLYENFEQKTSERLRRRPRGRGAAAGARWPQAAGPCARVPA